MAAITHREPAHDIPSYVNLCLAKSVPFRLSAAFFVPHAGPPEARSPG
jgi:hypothetical protein